ncbi:hypothetical protein FQZ97_748930 [compost metagenome]
MLQRQVAAGAELPGRGGVIVGCAVRSVYRGQARRSAGHAWRRRRIGARGAPYTSARPRRQRIGLPPPGPIAQAVQTPVRSETRLLQRLVAALPGQATHLAAGQAHAQPRRRPRLLRPVPFGPGQAVAVRAEHRGGVEVGAFDQHRAVAVAIEAHDAMPHAIRLVAFLHRQHGAPGGGVVQVAVAAPAVDDGRRVAGEMHLLVGLVDEGHALVGRAEGAAAVFVDAAAHRVRGQPLRLAVLPAVERAARRLRIELEPVQATRTDAQFGEVAAGGGRLFGAPARRGVCSGAHGAPYGPAVVGCAVRTGKVGNAHRLKPCRSGSRRARCGIPTAPGPAAPARRRGARRGSCRGAPTCCTPGRPRWHRR